MTTQPSFDLAAQFRAQLTRALVQRAIFCPVNGAVLDVRDCVVFVDRDGDPAAVVSPTGYQQLVDQNPERLETLAKTGITVDQTTIGRRR